ncbi:hypothetical protein GJ496_010233 [Pomphorhynchus laevis]|nr:hypothetical protein GJ496_010233 [Pomphorhynchus laevis]
MSSDVVKQTLMSKDKWTITDQDFEIRFQNGELEAKWIWIDRAPELTNSIPQYNSVNKPGIEMQSEPETSPAERAFSYTWRHPGSRRCACKDIVKSVYDVGDYVYVKPSNAKCTTRWNKGVITALISEQTAEVNGIPRHLTDIRPCNQVNKNEEQNMNRSEYSTSSDDEQMIHDTYNSEDESLDVLSTTTMSLLLAVDDSSHIRDVAQVSVFLRACDVDMNITEELLDIISLKGTKTGKDIFEAVFRLLKDQKFPP